MKNIQFKYLNKLREFRLKAGFNQEELAQRMQLLNSQNRISKWETGTTIPSLENLFKLCRIYKIKIDDIYSEFFLKI